MTVKYFKYAFATAGIVAPIPDPTQVSNVLSYQQGFSADYALDPSDPASLNIPLDQFNQMMNDVTGAIQQVQQNGFPIHITSAMNDGAPYAYSKNSYVRAVDGNNYYSLIDNNTDVPPTSNWQLVINGSTAGGSTFTGLQLNYWGASLPTGYVWANGQTIGNASSNATGMADSGTEDLFSNFWGLSSSLFPMFTSLGVPQARGGSAAADFAANYAITLPDCRERVEAGLGTMGGTTDPNRITTGGSGIAGSTLGASGGVETFALLTANLAIHNHASGSLVGSNHNHAYSSTTGAGGAHTHTLNGAVDAAQSPPSAYLASHSISTVAISGSIGAVGDHTHSVSGTTDNASISITGATDNTGSGTAHQNTQPTIICNKIIKL